MSAIADPGLQARVAALQEALLLKLLRRRGLRPDAEMVRRALNDHRIKEALDEAARHSSAVEHANFTQPSASRKVPAVPPASGTPDEPERHLSLAASSAITALSVGPTVQASPVIQNVVEETVVDLSPMVYPHATPLIVDPTGPVVQPNSSQAVKPSDDATTEPSKGILPDANKRKADVPQRPLLTRMTRRFIEAIHSLMRRINGR